METVVSLPTSKSELLKLISHGADAGGNEKGEGGKGGNKDAQYLRNNRLQNQLMRQDMHREKVERGMMELEDYTFKPEGKIRLQRYYEEVTMGEEDERSRAVEAWYREREVDALRDDVRRKAELLAEHERQEREAKRAANEARRAAVMERIRKQKEAEDEARRQAEEAQRAIEEEEKRVEMQQAARLEEDRSSMSMEDELSALAEQKCKEDEAEAARAKAEEDRIRLWEEGERRKAEEEEATRAQRIEELKAKRARLKEMQAKAKGGASQDRATLQAEAERQAKQMRIQNKAQFISRRIKAGTKPGQIIPPSPARISPMKPKFSHLAESAQGTSSHERLKLKTTAVPQAFLDEINNPDVSNTNPSHSQLLDPQA